MNKRRFVQLAGLSIAHRILPHRLWARPWVPTQDAKRNVIIVTFGGGVRYSETFAPDGLRNIPALAAFSPKDTFSKPVLMLVSCRTSIRRPAL